MAITFPRTDIITGLFQDQPFDLLERQELSRSANAKTYVKSLGEAMWSASFVTASLAFDESLSFVAKLRSLDGGIGTFTAYDLRRPYPKAYPTGDFVDSGVIASVNVNNKAIGLSGLPANFVISEGDYLAFDYGSTPSRALHQVMEAVTADGSGAAAQFEVRPHVRPGLTVSTPVVFKKPTALFSMEPGSLKPASRGSLHEGFSFSAFQVIE